MWMGVHLMHEMLTVAVMAVGDGFASLTSTAMASINIAEHRIPACARFPVAVSSLDLFR